MAVPPDRAALEEAVRAFLRAAGVDTADPELAETPARVAAAWLDEFLDGYQSTQKSALGELSPAPTGGGLVFLTHIDYTGVCPHHLLPYRGVAHLAYSPGESIAGFGRFSALVDTLAHRLVLQETLANQLARALVEDLGARGAAVILEAEQSCMTMRGHRRIGSRVAVEATAGHAEADTLARLWSAVRSAALSSAGRP